MSNINLLPWRESYKKQRQINFYILLAFSCLITLGICYMGKMYVDEMINAQNERNQYMQTETMVVERRISEISNIKEDKAELIRRIELIQELEKKRSLVTRLFNIMPTVTPAGVYIDSINFNEGKVDIKGKAETASTQVSNMVRNIESSAWLSSADVPSIVSGTSQPIQLYNFSMNFLVLPDKEK